MTEQTKKIYHIGLLILSFVLFIGLGLFIQKNSSAFNHLKSIQPLYIILLVFVHALDYWLLGMIYKLPLKKHEVSLKFKEWYGLCVSSELFNMLLPAKGGSGIRMLYLKDKKDLSMKAFLSMSFAIVVVGFTFLGIIGLIYCHFFVKKNHVALELLESVFIGFTVSGILLVLITDSIAKFFKFKRRNSPHRYLRDAKITSFALLFWSGIFILYPVKLYVSFIAIGVPLNLVSCFEISLILLTTSLFQVLPGNIGVKELVTAYVAKQYGIEFETALVASLIERTVLLVFLFPVGLYFYWLLFLDASLPKFLMPARLEQTSP